MFCAIVPAVNEAPRIGPVLDGLRAIPWIGEVLVVDDGSTDATAEMALWRGLRVVRSDTNRGKAAALAAGLAATDAPIVVFTDADLDMVDGDALHAAASRMIEQPDLSTVILRQDTTPLLNLEVAFSGQRVVRRAIALAALERTPTRYQIEAALNLEALRAGRVGWIQSRARQTHKVNKVGIAAGIVRELDMWAQIVAFAGIGGVLRFVDIGAPRNRIG